MKHLIVSVGVLAVVLGVLAAGAWCDDDAFTVNIKVTPHVIAQRSKAVWVTVHADIPYSQVASATVALNGIDAKQTFADDCGDLVAKFSADSVKAIVSPPNATLTLTGLTTDDVPFSGTDTVAVKK